MNAKLTLFGLTAIMMLAVGFIVIEDSDETDAADTFNLNARDMFEWGNQYVSSGTTIIVTDYVGIENGVTVRYTANPHTLVVTATGWGTDDIEIVKTNGSGGYIDNHYVQFQVNDQGYTFSSVIFYYGSTNAVWLMDNHDNLNQSLYTFTITSSNPTPPQGATFIGWSKSQNADYPDYVAGDSVVNDDTVLRLYPVFESQTIYTINLVYNANGGSGAPATQTYSGTDTSHTFVIPNTVPTPPQGATTFNGWAYTDDSDIPGYVGGDTVNIGVPSGSTSITRTLYAVWDVPMWTVSFTVNNPDSGSVSTSSVSVPNGSLVYNDGNSLRVGNNVITATPNTGYSFVNWTRNTGAVDDAIWTSGIVFTANFTISTYSVFFDNDYSPNGTVLPTEIRNVPYGTPITVNDNKITILGTTVTATPDPGYSFSWWSCIVPSGNIPSTVTGDMRITAYFTADRTFSLIYDMKGGSPQIPTDSTITPPSTASAEFTVSYTQPTKTGYLFMGWSSSSAATTVDIRGGDTVTVTWAGDGGSKTIYAVWEIRSDHIFNLYYDMNGGTPQLETQTYIGNYNTWSHTFFIPNTSPTKTGYSFVGWGIEDGSSDPYFYPGGYVTVPFIDGNGDLTLYAIWEEDEPMSSAVYWSNNNYNGSVSMLFKFDSSDNKSHQISTGLLKGTVAEDQSTTWIDSGYDLTVDISYPALIVTATLTDGQHNISKMVNAGNWSTFILTLDSDKGLVTITPIRTFESFTDYTVYDKQSRTVLDFSQQINGAAMFTIEHTESDEGTNSPRFSVVGTSVFLNTFGIVLYNPTINLEDYFPQYESIRVNFYSFALYGESITINGQTWPLDGSKITVQYVSDGSDHYLPGVMPNATVQTRTFELSNIYVTYQDGHCYLTFVNDRFTIDLGAYTPGNETISMQGLWYFATMVYEPYTAIEKHLSDWKILPETDKSQMVLLFLAILVLAGAAVAIHARKSGLGIVDLVIIGAALIFGLVLLG